MDKCAGTSHKFDVRGYYDLEVLWIRKLKK